MELRHIRSFLSVAETLHFGRSAQILHLSQPALSLQIKALEEEIGVELFRRNRHGTALTEAGTAFRRDAEIALDRLELGKRKAQWASAGRLGRIRIGFISTAGCEIVPKLLRRFQKSYPDVEFSIRNILTGEQLQMIEDGALDVGFIRLPIESRAEIEVTTVHTESLVAILPPGRFDAGPQCSDRRGEKLGLRLSPLFFGVLSPGYSTWRAPGLA